MLKDFESVYGDSSPAGSLQKEAISMELRDVSRTHLAISDGAEIIGFHDRDQIHGHGQRSFSEQQRNQENEC